MRSGRADHRCVPEKDPVGKPILATASAQKWLQQFHPHDAPTAELLLVSLRLIDLSHYDAALTVLVNRSIEPVREPVALFAARKMKDGELFFDGAGEPVVGEFGQEIGSEGATAFLLTRLGRANDQLLISPSIAKMKKECCRRLIFVDDIIGSGKRMRRFSDAVYSDETIKSWSSYGLIDGIAVVYAATGKGEDLVVNGEGPVWFSKRKRWRRNRLVATVKSERRPEGDTLWWSTDEKAAVTALCLKYAERGGLSEKYALGVNGTLSTMIFEHGCTNVAPSILWDSSGERKHSKKSNTSKKTEIAWKPLFPMRTIPSDIRALFRRRPPVKPTLERLRRLGYTRIEEREHAARQTPALPVDLVLVLAAAGKLRTSEKIATFLGLTRSDCDHMIRIATQRGLLDQSIRLTDLGRGELRRLARDPLAAEENLPSNESVIYIPVRLRGSTTS
jgi:hypothetical protein